MNHHDLEAEAGEGASQSVCWVSHPDSTGRVGGAQAGGREVLWAQASCLSPADH